MNVSDVQEFEVVPNLDQATGVDLLGPQNVAANSEHYGEAVQPHEIEKALAEQAHLAGSYLVTIRDQHRAHSGESQQMRPSVQRQRRTGILGRIGLGL